MEDVNVGLPTLQRFDDSSSNSSSSVDSSDDESSQVDEDSYFVAFLALHLYVTLLNNLQPIELSRENQISVNPTMLVNNLL